MTTARYTGPLRITAEVLQGLVRASRNGLPSEVCGFIVASKERPDVGERVLLMKNVATNSTHHYLMDDDQVRAAYTNFDTDGDEPIAVFHCHPTSEALMSDEDIAKAADQDMIYVIVSLQAKPAKVRAYRVKHFVGNSEVTAVEVQIVPDAPRAATMMAPHPWALAAGNRVRLTYQRANKGTNSTCVATVVSCGAYAVNLEPETKTTARIIPLSRIRSVHVLSEGKVGANMRADLQSYSAQLRNHLSGSNVIAIPSLLAALASAFPSGIEISMDEPR